jgi:hypothetical protein
MIVNFTQIPNMLEGCQSHQFVGARVAHHFTCVQDPDLLGYLGVKGVCRNDELLAMQRGVQLKVSSRGAALGAGALLAGALMRLWANYFLNGKD